MIICHKHKFIFLKTRKTAGTSIEIALSKLCGPGDIITRITKEDEVARQNLGYPGAQNFYIPFWKYNMRDTCDFFLNKSFKKFYNHMPAADIRQNIPAEIWNTYFKFCFERNPWDKMVSDYFWRGVPQEISNIEDYLRYGEAGRIRGYDIYSINNVPVVDKIYKFEDLSASMLDISERLGLEEPLKMPQYMAKSQTRTDKRHYSEILTPEEAQLISVIFAREIKLLGYKY